jgi:outer membrane receptor for ferrienterochelin and colicin
VAPFAATPIQCPGLPAVISTACTPYLARSDGASALVSFRPLSALRIDNTYLFTRLRDRQTGMAIFNNHIIRSKWNWQFNRELSFRMILQYTSTLANQQFTSLQTTKQLNGDFLFTYLIHPGTAIYVGYNGDFQNIDPELQLDPTGNLLRTRDRLINDGRLFFVKVSYLFRF